VYFFFSWSSVELFWDELGILLMLAFVTLLYVSDLEHRKCR
jgi:hypothetical protein